MLVELWILVVVEGFVEYGFAWRVNTPVSLTCLGADFAGQTARGNRPGLGLASARRTKRKHVIDAGGAWADPADLEGDLITHPVADAAFVVVSP
jgi:hypothetical protein